MNMVRLIEKRDGRALTDGELGGYCPGLYPRGYSGLSDVRISDGGLPRGMSAEEAVSLTLHLCTRRDAGPLRHCGDQNG